MCRSTARKRRTFRRPPAIAEERHVRRIWTRTPWQPRRLLTLAAAFGVLWVVSIVVGGPSHGQSLLCDFGGSCAAVYTRGALAVAGAFAGMLALIMIAVAVTRWMRARRSSD